MSFIWIILQEQPSTQCSNIGTKFAVDYSGDFTMYEIIESREALIIWVREVSKLQSFFIVVEGYLLVVIKKEHIEIEM